MRISTNFLLNKNQYVQDMRNPAISQNMSKTHATNSFISIYDKSGFYPCNVNFSGGQSLLKRAGNFLFATEGIPCAYSGIPMVPQHIFKGVLTEDALSGTSRAAIRVLSQFEENMFKTEKSVFRKLKELGEDNPKYSLQDLLMSCRPESLRKLQQTQYETVAAIKELGKQLPEDSLSKASLTNLLDEANILIAKDSTSMERSFKRKVFIAKLNRVRDAITPDKTDEQQIFDRICTAAQELKTSENNVHAFVVKYSGRSSSEIGQRLVEPSVSTFEHIIPDSQDGGSSLNNCLAVSRKFNHRRGKMPLPAFIKLYPDIPKNCQFHMDYVINLIRRHKYTQYASYPQVSSANLLMASEGLIKVNFSRLGRLNPATATPARPNLVLVES